MREYRSTSRRPKRPPRWFGAAWMAILDQWVLSKGLGKVRHRGCLFLGNAQRVGFLLASRESKPSRKNTNTHTHTHTHHLEYFLNFCMGFEHPSNLQGFNWSTEQSVVRDLQNQVCPPNCLGDTTHSHVPFSQEGMTSA